MDGYYGSPTQYYQRRGERNEQKIQNLLNMMLAMKQMKYDRGQQEWQRKRQTESDVRAQKYLDIQRERLDIARQPKQTAMPEWVYKEKYKKIPKNIQPGLDKHLITQFGADYRDKITYTQFEHSRNMWKTAVGKTTPQPTTFDKKRAGLTKKLIAGTITQAQFDEALYSIEATPTPEEAKQKMASKRFSNREWLRKAYEMSKETDARKMIKDAGGARPTEFGVLLDMPHDYNLAMLNRNAGVVIDKDKDVIKKYDDMFRLFREQLLPRMDWKAFLKTDLAKDPDIDKGQIKKWYDLYKK